MGPRRGRRRRGAQAVLVEGVLAATAPVILVRATGIAALSLVLIRIPGSPEAVATTEKPRFRTI
jgi:hypothetical protein